MKKTEKIEVRLSPEEKAALARLSEEDGRSVSEIVRGFVSEHVSERQHAAAMSQAKGRNTMSLLHKAVFLGVGIVAGSAGLYLVDNIMMRENVLATDIRFVKQDEEGRFREYQITSTIPVNYDQPSLIRIPADDTEAYQVSVELTEGENEAMSVAFDICLISEVECLPLARPELVAYQGQPSRVEFITTDNLHVNIRLSPKKV